MSLKAFVLVDEITNLSDARYCAGMGVDVLGFHFNDEKDDQQFTEISEWVAGVDFSATFQTEDVLTIQEKLAQHTLSYLIVHDVNILDQIQHFDKPIILRIDIDGKEQLEGLNQLMEDHHELVSYFYISCIDPNLVADCIIVTNQLAADFPILVDFGFEASTVEQFIEESGVKGIVLQGSEEEQTGFKDYGYIMDVLEELEED